MIRNGDKAPGATIVLVTMVLALFLGLSMSMTYEARSEATLASGLKLNRMYEQAAESALAKSRSQLANYWVDVDNLTNGGVNKHEFRFGRLLAAGGTVSPDGYGYLFQDGTMSMNSGMLDLCYEVFVNNNPDDPAHTLTGLVIEGSNPLSSPINSDWDLDGRVVLTSIVYRCSDPARYQLAVRSELVAPSGADIIEGSLGSENETGVSRNNTGAVSAEEEITAL